MVIAFKEKLYPSLPLLVAVDLLSVNLNEIIIEPGDFLQLADKRFSITEAGILPLDFPKPFTRFKHYPYIKVLEGNDPQLAKLFNNSIVIISYFATGLADHKVTAVSPYHPGSELLATAIQTLLEK